MKAVIDPAGRVLIPKTLRTSLGLLPGTEVDISTYGSGVQITPGGRAATLVREEGRLVIGADTVIDDDILFALIDSGRR
ncbi:MAG: AbrB/MazE/SpoVT family DNA-binding domain-containing protein [Bifidobacteriaceae bacterium]|jgi:AbrB family looped-hinge helix DNA binding protein|nr:AbrB/MazE/SpoVT family DNA-binding domain-containing protein [Bifidobacteriaceae bacterium]